MRARVILAAVLVGLLIAAGSGLAEHLPPKTFRCTYEVGNVDQLQLSDEDRVGVTDDGGINIGGCNFRLPEHPPILSFSVPVGFHPDVLQMTMIDDVFGNRVGAIFCNDVNNDHTCGQKQDEGEQVVRFCGTSPVIEAQVDSNDDGHKDFGHHLFVLVNGPLSQLMFCDPAVNPVGGTTGGVVNPAGGIFFQAS